jgi:hypothetical protein
MKPKSKRPLLVKNHLPLIMLGAAMFLYGLLTAIVSSALSNRAMSGAISAAAYRSQLNGFEQTIGLIAGIVFFILFILCAINAKGGVRTAFAIGALASLSPILTGRAENLLFNVIGIPTMGAGSVLAGAVTTLFFFLPMTILFIILAASRRVPRGCRWLSLASIFIVLVTSFYPIYVTVLAFLFKPGDPAVGRMIQTSTQVIRLRFLLPGLALLLLAFISSQFARKQPASEPVIDSIEKGE